MSKCDFATWKSPGYGSLGAFTSGPLKVVWHRTQGSTFAAAWRVFTTKRVCPTFTVAPDGEVFQHFDTAETSFSLANDAGGVQTNRDSAIQVEVVGFSGETMPRAQRPAVLRLMAWFKSEGVPWVWPMGRPPLNSQTGYGEDTPYRNARIWDTVGGHYGHSNVPENEHWDPAWTDLDWSFLAAEEPPKVAVLPQTIDIKEDDMNNIIILSGDNSDDYTKTDWYVWNTVTGAVKPVSYVAAQILRTDTRAAYFHVPSADVRALAA